MKRVVICLGSIVFGLVLLGATAMQQSSKGPVTATYRNGSWDDRVDSQNFTSSAVG